MYNAVSPVTDIKNEKLCFLPSFKVLEVTLRIIMFVDKTLGQELTDLDMSAS